MRYRLGAPMMMIVVGAVTAAPAQVSIGIGLPSVSIGINLGGYPDLVPMPGYPVYYSPRVDSNYFFYDGMYWVYQGDEWYASSWYNGPWGQVEPYYVPEFVLRIPVRYYRRPPEFFYGWQRDAAPRWGEHWGRPWEERRSGWDRWDRSVTYRRAELPVYQRQYAGDRYPGIDQQRELHSQNYHYQPKNAVVREHYQQQKIQAPTPRERARPSEPQQRNPRREEPQQRNPRQEEFQQRNPRREEPQPRNPRQEEFQQRNPRREEPRRPNPSPAPEQRGHEIQRPEALRGQERGREDRGNPRESNRGQGPEPKRDREKGEERPH